MSTVFYRRRAERFAQLLDKTSGGGRRAGGPVPAEEDLAELVAIGRRISAVQPSVEIEPDFRTELRAMLVAKAEREGIGVAAASGSEPDRSPRRTRTGATNLRPARPAITAVPAITARRARARGAIIIGVAVGAIAVSGMSAASDSALPGDALYGVKRSTERAQLALANSEVARGELFLEFARTRLAEVKAVQGDSLGLAAVLDDMDDDARQGVRLLTTSAVQGKDGALDAIDAFLTRQRPQVAAMASSMAGDDQGRALASLALLDAIANRTDELRAWLSCRTGASPRSDRLGPVPGTCGVALGPAGLPGVEQEQVEESAKAAPGPVPDARSDVASATEASVAPAATAGPTGRPSPAPSGHGGPLAQLGQLLRDLLG